MLLADSRILFLRAARGLHDNDSKFGRFTIERFTLWAKYLQNNGFHEMAGLRTKASFMAHMVRKRWCGDPGL